MLSHFDVLAPGDKSFCPGSLTPSTAVPTLTTDLNARKQEIQSMNVYSRNSWDTDKPVKTLLFRTTSG
jgi:hypothetical protein